MSAVGFVRWATIPPVATYCICMSNGSLDPYSVKAMLLLIDCKDLMLSNPTSLNGHVERGLKKDKVSVQYF